MPKEIPFLDWDAIDEELGKKNAETYVPLPGLTDEEREEMRQALVGEYTEEDEA